jgi:hypothetical protein
MHYSAALGERVGRVKVYLVALLGKVRVVEPLEKFEGKAEAATA